MLVQVRAIRYRVCSSSEDRKQVYWGAFMLGCAAFHQHRRGGYWLDDRAVGQLATSRFQALLVGPSPDYAAYVDDEDVGQACFSCGFLDGYRERAVRCGTNGLALHSSVDVSRRGSSSPLQEV